MDARQLFVPFPTTGDVVSSVTTALMQCATTILPADGVVVLNNDAAPITLASAALYQAPCATALPSPAPVIIANTGIAADSSDTGGQAFEIQDPFYASIFPVCYALAATTVTAYMLVIMLFITPRSFLDGGVIYLGRRGFTGGSSGGVTIGGRPWLQKVAALTVAISLTIATSDTFRVAEQQYLMGVQNAQQLQGAVMDGTELKVIRLISDTFLWLAQAQTLIRLFPRQREKVIIKWTAFALITLDVIFSALNSFQYINSGSQGNQRPRSFVDAVPALSYLFQLSLGLLYAAWVIYYALMKKRYAFYHPLMKNIVLVAFLSVCAVLVPVVFFVLDISKPEFTGWGDYVRWVGAAAASVVVWEWVERIEALEREEKKDGILGREVFDGDEMLEVSASEFPWLRNRKNRHGGGGGKKDDRGSRGSDGGKAEQTSSSSGRAHIWPGMSSIANRYRSSNNHSSNSSNESAPANAASNQRTGVGDLLRPPLWPSRPPPAVTPISRTDTASAASTVYAVRYQPVSETTNRTPDPPPQPSVVALSGSSSHGDDETDSNVAAPVPVRAPVVTIVPAERPGAATTRTAVAASSTVSTAQLSASGAQQPEPAVHDLEANETVTRSRNRWRTLAQAANPLMRRTQQPQAPPAEVQRHTAARPDPQHGHDETGRWDLRTRLEEFAAAQAEKLRERIRPTPETDSLPITVIPAPPRRGAALAQVLEEQETSSSEESIVGRHERGHGRRQTRSRSSSPTTSGRVPFPPLQVTTSNLSSQVPRQSRAVASPTRGELPPGAPPMWPGVRIQDPLPTPDDPLPRSPTSPRDGR